MGCNTSNETALAKVGGEEENQDEKENQLNVTNQDKSKPESAKTVVLADNGVWPKIDDKPELNSLVDEKNTREEAELEEAATKIQAVFRGHQTRKNMKQPTKQEEAKPPAQNLEEEFHSDDKELCQAATKIQASFRGHMIRKQMEKKENDDDQPKKTEHEEEELDIDLSDPELNKAAIKIQASFRGHMFRKDQENENSN